LFESRSTAETDIVVYSDNPNGSITDRGSTPECTLLHFHTVFHFNYADSAIMIASPNTETNTFYEINMYAKKWYTNKLENGNGFHFGT